MTPLRLAPAIIIALTLLVAPAAAQNTIYVDAGATGSETGDSWTDAYTSLQDALGDAANTSGDDEIWIAQGTYYPDEGASVTADDRSSTFTVPSGVTLRGRFSGDETSPDERVLDRGVSPTTLSGEIQQDGDPSNNAYHVLTLQGGTVEAVRITGGTANGTADRGEGGGAYVTGGTLKRSFLQGNRAKRGSAIYATNAPELRRLLVNDNHATETGTIYLEDDDATVNNITVADNTADNGANGLQHAGSAAQVTNSAFGPQTTNAVRQSTTVTATVEGTTTQEGQMLGGADLTARNADADTTVATLTSDTNGDYSLTTTYPDDQTYTLRLIATTPEHKADTTDISLGTADDTYTEDVDLQRLVHDLAITTEDDNTGSQISASGKILDAAQDTLITDYTSSGSTTKTINTATGQVAVTSDTDNYDPDTTTVSLGATKDVSTTNNLPPITYAYDGTVTDDNNNDLDNATVTLTEPDGNSVSTTTSSDGTYAVNATVNDGFEENESIDVLVEKSGYDDGTATTSADPGDRDKTLDFSLSETPTTYTISGDVDNKGGANLTGDITVSDGDGNTKTVSTNGDGTYSVDVSSDNGFTDGETVDVTATNVADYQSATNQVTLDKANTTKTSSFDLDVSTTTTTISLETTVVGNDLYQDGDSDGLGYDDVGFSPDNGTLDQVTIDYTDGSGNQTLSTATFSDGDGDGVYNASATITYADTTSNITFTQNDADFIDTWVMNNTDTETAPDLRSSSSSGFPKKPDYSGKTISVSSTDLEGSYEARTIPAKSPNGNDTKSTYDGEIFDGRWTLIDSHSDLLGLVSTTRIDNQNSVPQDVIDKMNNSYDTVIEKMEFLPISAQNKTWSEVQNIFNNRGENFGYIGVDGSGPTNVLHTSNGYAERGQVTISENESKLAMKSEIYSSITGIEKENEIFDSGTLNSEAKWLPRVIYSLPSQSGF